jgi:NTP pyrophosphatase (non-canonical NTP hydrolase)
LGDKKERQKKMTLTEYQDDAKRTAAPNHDDRELLISACGLAGETGEVVELIKKYVGHGKTPSPTRISEELGDVLWYVADIASRYDLNLDGIASNNIRKLRERYPNGFNGGQVDNFTEIRPTTVLRDLLADALAEVERLDWSGRDRNTLHQLRDSIGNATHWAKQI